MTVIRPLLALGLVLSMAGCAPAEPEADPVIEPISEAPTEVAEPTAPPVDLAFTEVAAEVGIDFVHNTGAFGEKWLPETMGSGCAWLDYDGDGDPDLLLLSGTDFEGHPTEGRKTSALFRNDGGSFVDVTEEVGLDEPFYAMGVTYGDFDGDRDLDLYITALGPNRLYRNDDGRFSEVAAEYGVDDPGYGASATWLDYDHDGDLDLFSLNYVEWTPETDIFCSLDGTNKSYCTPEVYTGAASRLYRNDGERFTDVSEAAGVLDDTGKALGVVSLDYDGDGWEDIFVANDTQPNFLFQNQGDGTFSDQGMISGVAFDENGKARGAMGVDFGDYDGSGFPSLVVGNFSNEMLGLYHNEGGLGLFIDTAPTTDLGKQSLPTLSFGTLFLDADLDGWLDVFTANGHVENDIQKVQSGVTHAQIPHLFRNQGGAGFEDVAPRSAALSVPVVGRGAASADFDADGDLDLLVMTSGGRPRLYRNDLQDGHSVRLELEGGAGSNPDGYGARVELEVGGATRVTWTRAASSYLSQSDKALVLGLGEQESAEQVTVYWPSGRVSRLESVAAGSAVTIREAEADAP